MRAALKDTDVGLANGKAISEREVHVVMDDMANAIRAKDVDAIRKRVSQWFSSFQGPIGLEMRHLNITAGDDVAFCSVLNGSTGTNKDGAKVEMWWRATNGFCKVDGKWLVTHGHSSEPFDVASGKALVDLKP
jgi:ketosteroid isomerase-like protein